MFLCLEYLWLKSLAGRDDFQLTNPVFVPLEMVTCVAQMMNMALFEKHLKCGTMMKAAHLSSSQDCSKLGSHPSPVQKPIRPLWVDSSLSNCEESY